VHYYCCTTTVYYCNCQTAKQLYCIRAMSPQTNLLTAICVLSLCANLYFIVSVTSSSSHVGTTFTGRYLSLSTLPVNLSTISPLKEAIVGHGGKEKLYANLWHDVSHPVENGKLNIPGYSNTTRYKLMVDIGLEFGSGLMCLLHHDKSLVLIGGEANLINFGLSSFSMIGSAFKLNYKIKPRILLIPTAFSNQDGYVEFNENQSPACGSILESSSKSGAFWCTETSRRTIVPTVRLDTILEYVPPNYEFHYLKIDVEGAEHLVLEGGGSYISKFQMITLESRPRSQMGDRVNEVVMEDVIETLSAMGFQSKCIFSTSYDCHFIKESGNFFEAARLHNLASKFGIPFGSRSCNSKYKNNYIDFTEESYQIISNKTF
jgi:FkbM family methyltransferase